MKTCSILAFACLVLFSSPSRAADISGQWKGEYRNDHGPAEILFQFQQNGEQLTGKAGEAQIQEGKVTGDDVSFAVANKVGKREVKITYTGKLDNDVLDLQVIFPGVDPTWRGMHVTAKRVP
jgi:hypothetical protein